MRSFGKLHKLPTSYNKIDGLKLGKPYCQSWSTSSFLNSGNKRCSRSVFKWMGGILTRIRLVSLFDSLCGTGEFLENTAFNPIDIITTGFNCITKKNPPF